MRLAHAPALAAVTIWAGSAAAQERSRSVRPYELSIVVPRLEAERTGFDGGTVVETDSSIGLGFNFDYRIGEQWTVGVSIALHEVDYIATIAAEGLGIGAPGDVIDGELESTTLMGHAKRYFGDWEHVAPYASAGLGVVSIDTNIAEGPPFGVCWWHPWWGYVCERVQPTRTSSDLSMALRLGVRWELGRRLFLDASAGRQWIDFDHADRPGFSELRVAVGFR